MYLKSHKTEKRMVKWKPTMTWSRAQKITYLIDEKLQLNDSRATLMLAVTLYTSTAKALFSLVKVKSVKHTKIH